MDPGLGLVQLTINTCSQPMIDSMQSHPKIFVATLNKDPPPYSRGIESAEIGGVIARDKLKYKQVGFSLNVQLKAGTQSKYSNVPFLDAIASLYLGYESK